MLSQITRKFFLAINIIFTIVFHVLSISQTTEKDQCYIGEKIVRPLEFISPLQTYTIFNKDFIKRSPRESFFSNLRSKVLAEKLAKDAFAKTSEVYDDEIYKKLNRSKVTYRNGKRIDKINGRKIDILYKYFNYSPPHIFVNNNSKVKKDNLVSKYQIVGVVRPPGIGEKKVDWFARKRPLNSKWCVRIVHPNTGAILRDLFTNGKIDIYGMYVNTGKVLGQHNVKYSNGDILNSNKPLIEAKYLIRRRSWKTLWNFNPKNLFTDSSGSFWRQRRILPGLYTDGNVVYESSYRYTDGKNGMKPLYCLSKLLKSNIINDKLKIKLLYRLKNDPPDIVVEY